MGHDGLSRRRFIGGAAAVGAASLVGGAPGVADASDARNGAPHGGRGRLPRRGEFVITNAYVMTMDETLQDIPRGDVHVRNGVIVGVGKRLRARGERLDGTDTIVMPGF